MANKSIKNAFEQFWVHVVAKCGDILESAKTYTDGKITTLTTTVNSHINNKSNPHSVTKSQVGLGNVDNTSDTNKPVSTAQQTAIANAKSELQTSINTVDNKLANYLPLSAGSSKLLTGPLGLTSNVGYGSTLPTSGFTGQLFFLEGEEDDGPSLPTGGTAGQYLVKNSSTDGDASWKTLTLPSLNYLPLSGGTVTGVTTFSNTTASSSTTSGAVKISGGLGVAGNIYGSKVYGAVWNDYAEYRICNEGYCAGRVVCENGDDTLSVAAERLQSGASVVSDTFGFAIGETDEAKCPVAVSGRVLAFPYEERSTFIPGEAVCAAPNGTVSRMTREEVREYPERIIGTVSAIPNYEFWGEDNIPVAGRIWIKVR